MLNCFKCNKELEPAVKDNPFKENQPYGGTVFTSHGHYGSTVFDPPGLDGSRFLEITICDECLVENKKQVLHCLYTPVPGNYEYAQWTARLDD
jgi:hypothetical protein